MLLVIYDNLFQELETTEPRESSSAAPYPSISVTCPSGECDFPIFRSLAVCSACHDFSDMLDSHCKKFPSCLPENNPHCVHSLPDCVLYRCVNTYSASVRMHNLNETVLDTWNDPNPTWVGGAGPDAILGLRPPAKDNLKKNTFVFVKW